MDIKRVLLEKKWLVAAWLLLLPAALLAQAPGKSLIFDGEPENMGPAINGKADERNPVISPDGLTIFFTRANEPKNTGGKKDLGDVWYSTYDTLLAAWVPAAPLDMFLNTTDRDEVVGVSPDGRTLLLRGVYEPGKPKGRGISSVSGSTATGWGLPRQLKIADDMDYNIIHYSLSADGSTLLIAADHPTMSSGQTDIFVCFRKGDGFTKPLNLGPSINTRQVESAPFLAPDGKTLFFSSLGWGGLGSADIFMCRRLSDDDWTMWSPPINLGSRVNSTGYDELFQLDAKGHYAYFVSYQNSLGGADIFRIKLPEEVKPKPSVLVSGRVYHRETGKPIAAEIIYEDLKTGKEKGRVQADAATGRYKIVLPGGTSYGFYASAGGYYPLNDHLMLDSLAVYQEVVRDLALTKPAVNQPIVLNNIFFERGSAVLLAPSYPELDRLAQLLKNSPTLRIEVAGHTDNIGDQAILRSLSLERAVEVVNYLVNRKGIPRTQLTAKGYAGDRLIDTGKTPAAIARNRRVEFTVLKE